MVQVNGMLGLVTLKVFLQDETRYRCSHRACLFQKK